MGSARLTTDHEEIRAWVEQRGGFPAHVMPTADAQGKASSNLGVLRIDFPGFSGEASLEHVSWDDWFATFEENELALLHQDRTADGQESRFNKLVSRRDNDEATGVD